jgi:hypothetical protein
MYVFPFSLALSIINKKKIKVERSTHFPTFNFWTKTLRRENGDMPWFAVGGEEVESQNDLK